MRGYLPGLFLAALSCSPLVGAEWEAIQRKTGLALAALSDEYFAAASPGVRPYPWLIVVDLTGGEEAPPPANGEKLVLAYAPGSWKTAAAAVVQSIRGDRREAGLLHGVRQPVVVAGGPPGPLGKFARELDKDNLELSLAVYAGGGSPRVPGNVRYALALHERAAGPRLRPKRPDRTVVLGPHRIEPEERETAARRLRETMLALARPPRPDPAPEIPAPSLGLFDRVVIMGASVSAGERGPSPGLLLARHMGAPLHRIFTFAEGGAPSDRHLEYLDDVARLRPSLILALDLFYHDFAVSLFLTNAKKRYLRNYVARLHATGALVVLGNLPPLVLLRHEHVNHYLEELTAEFPNLVVLDVRTLIESLEPSGMLVRSGGRTVLLRKQDVFADRLHPNLLGSTIVANFILQDLAQRFPHLVDRHDPIPLPLPERTGAAVD
jgi:hypothetical protein